MNNSVIKTANTNQACVGNSSLWRAEPTKISVVPKAIKFIAYGINSLRSNAKTKTHILFVFF